MRSRERSERWPGNEARVLYALDGVIDMVGNTAHLQLCHPEGSVFIIYGQMYRRQYSLFGTEYNQTDYSHYAIDWQFNFQL